KKPEAKEVPLVEVAQVERPVANDREESRESKEEWRTDSTLQWHPEVEPKKVGKKPVHLAKAPMKPEYDEAPAKIEISQVEPSTNYGAMETYRFQKGDTLMMVAFKIYGDYRKWKDLKKWNKGTIITEGVDVKYYVQNQKFGWRPAGQPYMVRTGDTLQIISMDKYKTTRKWKSIYENNRPLIRDPNLIFAGFTIYYRPMRDLASETK
ncbi:MAG: LysM peptidoglycan-binding domain-containing protein, partial [Bdellovibrionales bacterium]|nr:LysM peptidoglycan-binding domain-containing protein [Bdellovibrionales bacterium]